MAGLANINIKFSADLKEFSDKMQNANRTIQKLGKKMQAVGQNLSIGLTAPIVALGGLSVKTFATFEQSMANVAAVSGATGSSFAALEKSALDLGAATQFSAEQVAQLQLNYSKLGFSPEEIIQVTAATLDLAVATGEDLATSATVAASTLRGFGLEANEMGRVIDVMASSFSASALDLGKFQTSMAILAPVAKNAGVSIEEATSFLSILTDRGVDASSAGSALRNIFLTLAGSGETLQHAMTKISTSTNKNKTAFETFGKLGATVASIMADNTEEAKSLQIAYEGSAGSASAMATVVGGTLQGAMLRMKSSIEGAAISIGQQLAPFVEKVSVLIGDLATRFKELSPETKKLVVIVAGLAAAIGPLLVVLGVLMTTVIPGLITAFGGLKISLLLVADAFELLYLLSMANPFTALAIAVAAIASYFLIFNKNVDETIEKQKLLAGVNDTAARSIANEKAKLAELLFIARNENIQKSARIKAVRELNKLSPKYLGNLTLEKINTDDARIAVELYNTELLKTARIKAAQSKLQELQSKIIDIELAKENQSVEIAKENLKINKDTGLSIAQKSKLTEAVNRAGELGNLLADKELLTLKDQENQILKIIVANKKLNTVVSSGSNGDKATSRKKATSVGDGLSMVGINIVAPLEAEAQKLDTVLNGMQSSFINFSNQASSIITQGANNVLSGFGEMIAGLADGSLSMGDVAGGLLKIIGNMAVELGKSAIAIGVGMLAIKLAFTNPLTAIAAGVALVAVGTLIANSANITAGGGQQNNAGAFANGGMVGGSSFSGDKLFARVNSGEMILNKGQQSNMAGMMDSNRGNVNVNLGVGTKFVGRDLIFFLREEGKKLTRTQG